MREQLWLYPLISAIVIMAVAHPSGMGWFPLVAVCAPYLITMNIGFVVYVAIWHRSKIVGVSITSILFVFFAYVIIESTRNF